MNNHRYLTGTLPSSPNATITAVYSRLSPTTGNNYQFTLPSTDHFSGISQSTGLAPTLYHSQHIGMTGENGSKNIVSACPIPHQIASEAHTQHTWDMIQEHYDMGLNESIGTTSSSPSTLSAPVKQQNSPSILGVTSVISTPPLYQELMSPSTSSSVQAVDSSKQQFHLQHPPHSQMVPGDPSTRPDNTPGAQSNHFLKSGHTTVDTLGDSKNNEQQALQQQNNNSKPMVQEHQITQQPQQQQSQQLGEPSLSASRPNLSSSPLSPSDFQSDQHFTKSSNQQRPAPVFASSNHHMAPDQHIKNDPCNGKRLHRDSSASASKGLGISSSMKKPKTDFVIQQSSQQQKVPTSASSSLSLSSQPNKATAMTTFTAASFEHMTREQMVERLIFLENERLDIQHRLEQTQVQGLKNFKINTTDTPSEYITGKNDGKAGDDDDDDDDEVESISSGAEVNPTNDDKTEMKCLWKNCGIIHVGVRDLTDHIVSAHVGGGKPLYRCEWENCRRSHKPFTKRHKICNHLRVHTGERPFVCDKPGCEKRFSRLDSLTTHIKTHSTVRPFICHITGCEKAYYHLRSLKKHLKLHEDEQAKENELANSTLDTSNSNNLDPSSVSYSAVSSSSDPQSLQQPNQHHPYPFVEGISLPQFLLQPGSNITTASSRNEPMIDQSIIDSAQSLFDPLSFQTLSALPIQHNQQQQQQQQKPQSQPQFMQLDESISQITIPRSTNHDINMMDTLRQQQRLNDGQQTGYNVSLPMMSSQQDGFCL